jgi:D-xylose transport system substrate-binding protein
MTPRRTLTTAAVAALVLVLAACGSGGGAGGDSGGASRQTAGKVGVILPDTESSTRWETADRPLLEKAFEQAGVEHDVQNAEGDAQRMATIAEQMIADGVTVLAIVSLDSASGALIERRAAQQGVQTIDYDRLTLGGSAEYYVSFDNVRVGTLQGEGLTRCLDDEKADDGTLNIAFLDGSPDDHNATLFSSGAHAVLDEMKGYTAVAEEAVPEWDPRQAAAIFEQMYTRAGGNIQGVLAANDGLADAVISVLGRDGRAGEVPVTGQDATVEGLQNILAGDQCMTVYKPIEQEVDALADLAVALIDGDEPETTDTVRDPEGDRRVPSMLLDPVPIYRDDVKRVIVDDRFQSAADVCVRELKAICAELGIE